jgi:hypothetical protein
MKKLLLIFAMISLFPSCQEEGDLTRDKLNTTSVSPVSTLKFTGVFAPTSGITVAGGVKIYLDNNDYKLELDNFSISSGPDLKVYLSKSSTPTEFVNLGNLTSKTVYVIPDAVDISLYKYAIIHCQQYNHTFAIAQLNQN